MVNLVLPIVTAAAEIAKKNFVGKTRQVSAVQEKFLRSLLQDYSGTEFGQRYHFDEIKTIERFRQRVPILSYDSYSSYVERIAQGEKNILTSDDVVYFNVSSGSTGKQKLIPVTKRSRKILNRANRVGIGFIAQKARKNGFSLGKMLLTTPVKIAGMTSGGIPYGTTSSGDLRLNELLYKQIFAQPYEALQATDSLTRNYLCLLFALRNPQMKIIAANFPVLALQLAQYLEDHAEELIKDLATGAIAPWLKLEPELRNNLQQQLSPAPEIATRLKEILRSEGRLTPKLAWQNLSCILTARGGTSNFYLERFSKYFGNTPIFGGIYASSEATFGICHHYNHDDVILAIESGFFEFIPSEYWEKEQPPTLLPQEVEVGKYYRILVSGYSGLYRYDVGDVVQVVGFYENTPLIVFRHRRGGFLSSISEKTNEFHVIHSMHSVQKEFNLPLENFCVTLSTQVPSRYLVNIELLPDAPLKNPREFLAQFETKLQQANTSYGDKRQHNVIPQPHLRILVPGSFALVREKLLKRGIPDTHLKFPHISDNRQFLNGLTIQQEIKLSNDED
ncbi:MAG: GH3 auxin-responsive promoter family protein [Cyanobacteria bacterium P01_A01_bin.84]